MILEQKAPEETGLGKLPLICLTALGAMEVMLMVLGTLHGGIYYYIAQQYLAVPGLLFLGAVLVTKQGPRRAILPGLLMVGWMVLAQLMQRIRWEEPQNLSIVWSAYLLAFPFAAVTKDGGRQKGLRTMGWLYTAAALILSLMSVLLVADVLPAFLHEIVDWDGNRLMAVWHPNITACILMVGIAFSLGFFFEVKNGWAKAGLMAAAVLQFGVMALTNCRTSILITCAMVAAIVFFCIARKHWVRILAGVLAALVVFVGLFAVSDAIFDKNNEALVVKYLNELAQQAEQSSPSSAEEEAVPDVYIPGDSGQGTLLNDLKTLNGRTWIWEGAVRAMKNEPEFLLRGTSYVGPAISRNMLHSFEVEHAHNSWMEVLLGFGLPGLVLALYFTWLAVKNGLLILFRDSRMWRKCVALLTLCLLVTGFLEPYLFTGYIFYNFINLIFFLCVGYLDAWQREA